jgi:hypothetical protein
MTTIKELATTAAANFETGTRTPAQDPPSTFRRFKQDGKGNQILPWCQDLSRAAHDTGALWPDDHRYAMIEGALDAIAEHDPDEETDPDDFVENFARSAVSDYTKDRNDWLASDNRRQSFCDEARDEGMVTDDATMNERIAEGWCAEAREVFGQVIVFLGAKAEADDGPLGDGAEV